MKRRTIIMLSGLLALALFAATLAAPTRAAAQAENTIAEIVAENEDFSTLLTALEAAMLVQTFDGDEQYTVFAPTNAAFEALPEGALEALLDDPLGDLTDVLAYHVLEGAVPSTEVVQLESADTLAGAPVSIAVTDDGVVINDVATVTMVDIMASNGVIHVIDAVLIPPAAEDGEADDAAEDADSAEEDAPAEGEGDEAEPTPSIAALVANDPSFSTLNTALATAGLTETLSTGGAFTVFAPTDDAFALVPEADLTALLDDPEGALTDVLLYHVLPEPLLAEELLQLDAVDTVQGGSIALTVTDDGLILNDSVAVIATDVTASNGIIHVIDAVLLPPADADGDADVEDAGAEEAEEDAAVEEDAADADAEDAATDDDKTEADDADGDGAEDAEMDAAEDADEAVGEDGAEQESAEATELPSIAEIVASDSNFSTLLAALEAAGLADALAGEGDFTVFAPTNDAFAALPEGFVDELLLNKWRSLERLLLYHVVDGALGSAEVVEMTKIATLNGTRVKVTVTDDGVFLNDTVKIVMVDVPASNGVVHVIDGVLVPPGLQKAPYYDQADSHMMAPKAQPYQGPSHAKPPRHQHPHKHGQHQQHQNYAPPRCHRH